jgi:O-antigen ligase
MALLFLASVWMSYLVSAMRSTVPVEQLPGDRAVLNVVAWVGLVLVAMDGIDSRESLDLLLRRVVLFGGIEAAFGIVQFITRRTFLEYLNLPGLTDSGIDDAVSARGSFVRPPGTTGHPIEFGVLLSVILPLALHYAVADRDKRGAVARWFPVTAIALASPLSISRSAIICTFVVLVVLLAAWPPARRRTVYVAAVGVTGLLSLALPGFLGTFVSLFQGIGSDTSTTSRTDSYAIVWAFFAESPIFGRGMGTFLPRYHVLDNQYAGSLIEVGLMGVGCMVALFVAGALTGHRLDRPTRAPSDSTTWMYRVGPALSASIAGAAFSYAFFDAWGFPTVPSLLFLSLGCVGALRRLSIEGQTSARASIPEPVAS